MAAEPTSDQELQELLDELADRPMSEPELETAFARLDAVLDAAQ